MEAIITNAQERMKKSVSALEEELAGLRTGRASAAMFDKIKVQYYGTPTPLNQVASVSVPEPRLVVIQPWDKGALSDIEKAIYASELSLNPSNDGKVIRISIPPMTEERRKEVVKLAKNAAEQGRVAVRNIRRDANDELKKLEKNGEISEDDLKRGEEKIQKLTDQRIEEINTVLAAKETEILEI
ncbi:ribosome recycling factor [Alkalispirochaeta sphaeroplastigenens]|uniref:Ribosome-recycling factor n=1 Tax=Alkalispirochaeta sphaeroplastigenens TaxID=1187066 RepID=A0A2S4JFI6_9SPIO|nr:MULTISPECIES: ribosome recycling factor [Alkalispirochaeta]POQ98314.1 ribosome recycling factor [Alkalispirochaeta sphaeroplastigenens]